ncbi:MAG TPA: MFS transporter, partial [Acidimicrobiales bacterium]|nr:MFS transporter [Acidimicrobiales bacterium]
SASMVATRTLQHLQPWQDQFVISGVVCLVVVAVAFFGLRELSPQLRDQLMVSEDERALVEARARGIDVDKATAHPLRSMLRPDLVASSLGISLFLLIYFASVSVLTLYWVVIFNRTTADANGINTWYWAVDAVMLVLVGMLSDRLRVRKPFMLVGSLAAFAVTLGMIVQVSHPHTGYYDNVTVAVLLGLAIGCAYTPWMASYTEQVEAHNPALSATGLAVWGWILRIVVAGSFIVLPMVITTASPLVDSQVAATALQTLQAAQPYVPAAGNTHPAAAPPQVIAALRSMKPAGPGQALAALLQKYGTSHDIVAAMAAVPPSLKLQVEGLLAFSPLATTIQNGGSVTAAQIKTVSASSPQLARLLRDEPGVLRAQKSAPGEWKRWWWVCALGQLVFAGLVFFMRGRWSPRAAKRDFDEHERLVEAELARLHEPAADGVVWYPALMPTGTEYAVPVPAPTGAGEGTLWVPPPPAPRPTVGGRLSSS